MVQPMEKLLCKLGGSYEHGLYSAENLQVAISDLRGPPVNREYLGSG